MKRSVLMFLLLCVMVGSLLAQQQPGAQRGGGAAGGGQGRGGRGAPPPPATGPLADAVNAIVDAINKGDATALNAAITADAQWLDEDGHMPPASAWIPRLTGMPKKLTITNLRVKETSPDTGWAAFNYTLEETAGKIEGLNSMMFKKTGDKWQAVLVHAAVNTKALAPH